ncbi:MAG: hypothetical protein GY810_30660 [Aureispira sp.]|nr:hypothetical protein [Aureispira sp.]
MIINDIKTSSFSVKKDEKLIYKYVRHASVGIGIDVDIEDTGVLKLSGTKERNVSVNPDSNGGDKIEGEYTFEVLQKGSCRLSFKKIFRDKVKFEDVWVVEVV